MKTLTLSLSQNAHSFLEDALVNAIAAEKNPSRWKFAILSLVQAIELSLKKLLSDVHPLFVYENIDKPNKTLSLDTAVTRVGRVSRLKLSPDETEALQIARVARNEIIHYEVSQDVEQLKLSFSRLLGFLSDFHDTHFGNRLYDFIDKSLWAQALKIQDYGKELYDRGAKKLSSTETGKTQETIILCSACKWPSLVVNEDGDSTCYMCGYRTEIVFCARCEKPIPANDSEEEGGRNYCPLCIGYVSSDYWYEQRIGT